MDDFYDDQARHENQEKDPGQRGQAVIPACPGPVLSNAFRMSDAPEADPVDWESLMLADMPERYGYNVAKGGIFDLETGKALCGPRGCVDRRELDPPLHE